jgi:small-conductance mechanosensitive channel
LFLQTVGPDIEKVVGILLLRFVALRLDFLSISLRLFINDAAFFLGLIFIVVICLKLVNFTADWYRRSIQPLQKGGHDQLDPAITLLQHAGYILIIIIGILIALVHFGVEISVFTSMVLILGLGAVFGARAVVADLVSGFIILVGRPFREGDGLQLQGWPDLGIVEDIGSRATRIRFYDNRAVIVRNSEAINDQLLTYSTSDSTLRVQTDIRIAYHADLNQIRKLITDTVRGVKGVLPDEPIEILFREFGDSARLIRVRWWIPHFAEEPYNVDDVNSAIEAALNEAGFSIPYSTLDLNLSQIEELRQMMSGSKPTTVDQEANS